jgi:hypothetical protein
VEGQVVTKKARLRAAHLICGSKLWTLLALICCAYFAKIAVTRIYGVWAWSHDPWDVATHLIWVLFMIGLITETRCWKERLLFALVLANFGLAFVMGLWTAASATLVGATRLISAGAWVAAALVSLALMFSRGSRRDSSHQQKAHVAV